MTEEQNGTGFGKGILIGGLIGAAIALFLAPKSGVELRRDVRKRANGLRTSIGRYTRKLKKRSNGLLEKALSTADEVGEEAGHRRTRQHATNA